MPVSRIKSDIEPLFKLVLVHKYEGVDFKAVCAHVCDCLHYL